MPSPAGTVRGETRIAQAMPMGPWGHAALCERAVQAIWRTLDEHDLLDEQVRHALASTLEPLNELPLGGRPQRLIKVLRQPNPLDPSHLYWLTRRLLTLVPELQALAMSCEPADGHLHGIPPLDAIRPLR